MSGLCEWDDCIHCKLSFLPFLPSFSRTQRLFLWYLVIKRRQFLHFISWQLDSGEGWVEQQSLGVEMGGDFKRCLLWCWQRKRKRYTKEWISQIRAMFCSSVEAYTHSSSLFISQPRCHLIEEKAKKMYKYSNYVSSNALKINVK